MKRLLVSCLLPAACGAALGGAACGERKVAAPADAARPAVEAVATTTTTTAAVPLAATPPASASTSASASATSRYHAIWAQAVGGMATQAPRAVTASPDGGLYVAGYFEGDTEFSPQHKLAAVGASDGFVAKYDARGRLAWVVTLASPGEDSLQAIAVAPSGDIIVGGNVAGVGALGTLPVATNGSDDAVLAALTPAGVPRWVTTFGGADSDGVNAVALAGERIFAGGSFRGAMTIAGKMVTPARSTDAFIVAVALDGAIAQTAVFGDLGEESLIALAPHGEGGVAIVLRYTESLTLGRQRLMSAGTGTTDFAVAALDAALTPTWAVGFGNAFNNIPGGLAAVPGGDLVVSGSFDYKLEVGEHAFVARGASDVFIARLSPQGMVRWATACGGPGEDIIYGTAAAADGTLTTTGWFEGELTCQRQTMTSAGGKDAMLLTFDAKGQAIAMTRFGDADHDQGRALVALPNHRWGAVGVFRVGVNFGEISLLQTPAVAAPRRADGFVLATEMRQIASK